jgi:hypothetical protein
LTGPFSGWPGPFGPVVPFFIIDLLAIKISNEDARMNGKAANVVLAAFSKRTASGGKTDHQDVHPVTQP